ncbi:MAG: glycine--tRNA ligase subunit beta [Gammaproteobacteria bacterium]
MANTNTFLVELGMEELPPKALEKLQNAFADIVRVQLSELELDYSKLHAYSSPRRLAIQLDELQLVQADKKVERRGPPVKIAYDADGNATKAAEKFAESCGITVDEIKTTKTDKGEWLYYEGTEKGASTDSLMPDVVQTALTKLPIPKRMRWGDSDIEFVRPVHWAVMMLGSEHVPATLIGMKTGTETFGHRFLAPGAIKLNHAGEYVERLKDEGWVIVDAQERKQLIHEMVEGAARNCGGEVVSDDELLSEIAALVEWPVPVAGEYDKRYLELPPEVLISTLKDHQRYFPVVASAKQQHEILPWFITVSNLKSKQPDEVKKGNERVVAPRLADAEFFWTSDKQKSLHDRVGDLEAVVFQQRLGSLADKVSRVQHIAERLAEAIGGDVVTTSRAATLSKCDLLTGMVGEFPDLQGIMGRYFAIHDNEPAEVAEAMAEQYLPRFAGDELPTTNTGRALALADRVDTLVSIFALGQKPTGTKDPFGLRRAALGVLRIIIESGLKLDLPELLKPAAEAVMPRIANDKKPAYTSGEDLANAVFDYMMERLYGYFVDDASREFSAGMFAAVAASKPTQPLDFQQRMEAVREFMQLPESDALAAANKRIANILKSAKDTIPATVDSAHLSEEAEQQLHKQVVAAAATVKPLQANRDYAKSLSALAKLREPVDAFFDQVMVMDENPDKRQNRLALLSELRGLFLHTADFSKLQ